MFVFAAVALLSLLSASSAVDATVPVFMWSNVATALSHVDAVTDVVGEHRFSKAIDALVEKIDSTTLTVVFNVRGLSSDEFFAESRARAGRFTALQSTLTRAAAHVVLPFTFATRARSPVDVVRAAFGKRALSTRAIGVAQVAADAQAIVATDASVVVVDVAVAEIDSLLTVLGQLDAVVGSRNAVAMVVGSLDAAEPSVRRRQVEIPGDDNTTTTGATTTTTSVNGTAAPTKAPSPTPTPAPVPTPAGDLAPIGMWDAILIVFVILLITACGFERLGALQTPTQFVQAPKKAKQN